MKISSQISLSPADDGCCDPQEVLVRTAGLPAIAELSDAQLQGMAGGPVLQLACLHVTALVSKKPLRRLRDMLLAGVGTGPLVVPLYLLMCRQMDHSLYVDADPFCPEDLRVTAFDSPCACTLAPQQCFD